MVKPFTGKYIVDFHRERVWRAKRKGHCSTLACSSTKISRIQLFFFPLLGIKRLRDLVLSLNSRQAGLQAFYTVLIQTASFFAEFSIMLSLQNLIHGNHCYTLGISSNRKGNVLTSLSLAQKNMLCICLHIGHHAARKSLYETKVSRNWHELLWARKAPLKLSQKSCW